MKLLRSDFAREHNYILQCLKYIVQKNFFQPLENDKKEDNEKNLIRDEKHIENVLQESAPEQSQTLQQVQVQVQVQAQSVSSLEHEQREEQTQ